MRTMAHTAVMWPASAILVLMLAATVLSVAFATRGAMATNRPIVEVLHFVGAKDGFIASQFQRHFLVLGLEGGALGGGAAILTFGLGGFLARDRPRHGRRRSGRGPVRGVFHRDRRLCRDRGADRADRSGHGADLAAYRQHAPCSPIE